MRTEAARQVRQERLLYLLSPIGLLLLWEIAIRAGLGDRRFVPAPSDIAERFSSYNFVMVARALGYLHQTERLWQDPRGRMCVRGSKFAAVPPKK